jgi:hypothetical protein
VHLGVKIRCINIITKNTVLYLYVREKYSRGKSTSVGINSESTKFMLLDIKCCWTAERLIMDTGYFLRMFVFWIMTLGEFGGGKRKMLPG